MTTYEKSFKEEAVKLNGWLHTPRRRPKGLTRTDPEAMQAENLIKQDFSAEEPYEKLLTDITQVQCADGKLRSWTASTAKCCRCA